MQSPQRRKILGVFKYFLSLFFCFAFFASADQIVGYFLAGAPLPPSSMPDSQAEIEAPIKSESSFGRRPASIQNAARNHPEASHSSAASQEYSEPFLAAGASSEYFDAGTEATAVQAEGGSSISASMASPPLRANETGAKRQAEPAPSYGHGVSAASTESDSTAAEATETTSILVWDQSKWDEGVWAP